MSEYRDYWRNISGVSEAVALLERELANCGAEIGGAMLSTVSFTAGNEQILVAGRLVFCETRVSPRAEHRYPAFVLRDEWLSREQALQLVRDAPTGVNPILPGRIDESPSAQRVLTTHGLYGHLTRPSAQLSFSVPDRRTPEPLPAVAFGLPPFPTWNAAAMWWLEQTGSDVKDAHALVVLVPDYRAVIDSAELVRGDLRVKVSIRDRGRPWQLHFVLGEDQRPVRRGSVSVASSEVVVQTQARFRKAELWLIEEGATLPSVHRTFWGLRDEHVALDADEVETHRSKILGGESDTVELKPFLADDPKKVTEVAESITAFANARGGVVYVGVQDNCVPQGLAKLEALHRGDKRTARDAQNQKIREVLGRIDPVPVYSLTWVDLKTGPVLVVETGRSSDVHALDGSRVLVRRGSSDRHATRSELEELFRERGGVARGVVYEDDLVY